jgi:hypothetical protein
MGRRNDCIVLALRKRSRCGNRVGHRSSFHRVSGKSDENRSVQQCGARTRSLLRFSIAATFLMTIKSIVPAMLIGTVDRILYRCPVCNAEKGKTIERPASWVASAYDFNLPHSFPWTVSRAFATLALAAGPDGEYRKRPYMTAQGTSRTR